MYWDDHEKSKHTFAGDWFAPATSSHATLTATSGTAGRADDLLKVGGIWVAPLEIENCLLAHAAVAECAVVGYEEDGLILPRAFVVLRGRGGRGARGRAAGVRTRRVSRRTSTRATCVSSTELPKTAAGKVDRKALRSAAERGIA